jgi:hypothetical protein
MKHLLPFALPLLAALAMQTAPRVLAQAPDAAIDPNSLPPWDDRRFTVRYMTGAITQQPTLITPSLASKFGYWSWEDRGPQTYPIYAGAPEAMNIVATWRHDPEAPSPVAPSRSARQIGPHFAMVVSWNE